MSIWPSSPRIDAAAGDSRQLQTLLGAIVAGKERPFESAFLFRGGYARGPFVLAAARGATSGTLARLAAMDASVALPRMHRARILGQDAAAALAIPFSFGTERYVVVARR